MKLSFGSFSTVLIFIFAPGHDMANENKPHLGSFSTVISNKNLRSSKETILSSTSPFSMAEGTDTDAYKKLSHQSIVHDDTNRMEKDNTNGDGDGLTDDDKKLNSSSYHSPQGVNEGGGYDKHDENNIAVGGLLDVLVGVYVCMCVYVYDIRIYIR